MPKITANNISIYYEEEGLGEPLILIGGLTADHNVWKSTLRVLAKYFHVITFDNRGAGQTDSPDLPYTTKMMADDTALLMQALNIPKAHVIGHSMGGCVAQQMAIHHPDKVNKLVIACSRAERSSLADMVLSMRRKLIDEGVSDLTLAEYMMPFLFTENFLKNTTYVKGFIQWTLQNPYPQTHAGFKNQLHAVITHDISKELNQIKAQTLIIAGEEDCLMPPKIGKAFASSLPNAQFQIIPEAAHMPHVEQSKLFTETVLAFLSSTK